MVPELNSPLVCSLSGGFSEKGDVYYFWLLRVVRLLTQSRGINWLGHRIFRGVTGKQYKKTSQAIRLYFKDGSLCCLKGIDFIQSLPPEYGNISIYNACVSHCLKTLQFYCYFTVSYVTFGALCRFSFSAYGFDTLLGYWIFYLTFRCYVMRLRYIVLFRYFRLGYQFYVVILRDISTHHALK